MAKTELRREETPEGRLLLGAADWLTLLLLSAGMIFPCLSACGISDRHGFDLGAVLAFCVFASLAASALFAWRRWIWAAPALAAGDGLILWRLWKHVTEDWLLGRPPWLFNLIDEHPGTLFLLYALAILVLGWIVVRVRAWWLAAALVTLPLLPAIQSGVLPSWGWMLAGFAGWGSMLLTALFGRRDADCLGRARFLSLAGMAALVLALVMSLPAEGYVRPRWATDARTSLIRGVTRQMERFFDLETLEDGLLADLGLDFSLPSEEEGSGPTQESGSDRFGSTGDGSGRRENLLAAGPRRYRGRRELTVRVDPPGGGRLYLRGGSLGIYTGDSWEMVRDGSFLFFSDGSGVPEAQPALYPVQTAAEAAEYTMSIRDFHYQGIHFYPYRLTDGGGWTDESGALTLWDDEGWSDGLLMIGSEDYQISYIPGGPGEGFTPLSGALAKEEARYRREVVYTRYLDVPSAAWWTLGPLLSGDLWEIVIESMELELAAADGAEREALEKELERIREMADSGLALEDFDAVSELPEGMEDWRDTITAASRTAALLAALASYDLNVPAMEPGEDFVTRFLQEGRGYCVHFATAGALLLRMQGIPTRYVTGYTVQLDSQGRGEVLDSDAHAWVEIYLDGYGWYPVEMSPGYTGGVTGVELAGILDEEIPDETDTPEPDETPEEEVPDPAGPEDREEEDLPGETPEEAGTETAAPRRIPGRAALALAALCALYALSFLPRNLARKDPDTNRSALRAYCRYRRVLRLGGAEDEVLEELGRKAKFSQHTLTEEERTAAWSHLEEAAKRAQARQKKPLRWLFPLLRPVL